MRLFKERFVMKKILLLIVISGCLNASDYDIKFHSIMTECAGHKLTSSKLTCEEKTESFNFKSPYMPQLCTMVCNNRTLYYSEIESS